MGENRGRGPVACPYCRSDNTLPFEEESQAGSDLSVLITILTALSVLALYFAFVVTSYLYFPLVVFIAIIVTTRLINRQERKGGIAKKKVNREFICLGCNTSFSDSIDS